MTAKGIVFIVLSSFCFSLMNIIITHYCMFFPRADLLIARGMLGCILIIACFRPNLQEVKSTIYSGTVLIRSLLASIALMLLYFNLNQTNASTASFLQSLSFLFVLIIEFSKRQIPVKFLVIAGGLILLGIFETYLPRQISGVVFVIGILSALFSAASIVALKKATLTASPIMIALSFLIANLLLGVMMKFIEPSGIQNTVQAYIFLIAEALLAIIGQLLFSYGAKSTSVPLIIPCSFMTVLFSLLIEGTFYGVTYRATSLAGMALVVSGIILLSITKRHLQAPADFK